MQKKMVSMLAIATLSVAFATQASASSCEDKAVSQSGKPLTGAAKNAFVKKCEAEAKGGTAEAPKTSQQQKMKDCNAEAKTKALKGDERKAFMKGCLSSDKK
jgi:hypothetical protein